MTGIPVGFQRPRPRARATTCRARWRTSAAHCGSARCDVLYGQREVQPSTARPWSRSAADGPADQGGAGRAKAGKSVEPRRSTSTSSCRGRRPTRSSSCSPSSATSGDRHRPPYPDQDTDPDTPGPAVFDGPLHNAIPEPDRARTTRRSGRRTTGPTTSEAVLRRGRRVVAEDLLREAVLGALHRRRRGHRLGEGEVQRGPLRPQQRLPL